MTASHSDRDAGHAEERAAILHAFEARLLHERTQGQLRSLKEHLAEHDTAHATFVARRWLEVAGELTAELDNGLEGELRRRYRVVRRLGSGGQGTVYLAEVRNEPGRLVALKQLHGLDRPGTEHLRLRFRQGAQVLERLSHERICGLLEADLEAEVPYLVMQYVEGESLAAKIARTIERHSPDSLSCIDLANPDLDEEEEEEEPDAGETHEDTLPDPARNAHQERDAILDVLRLIEDAAQALHFAHELGVVHRDIKPGNIMVTPMGRAVIMDFDMARDDHPRTTELTQAGDAFGTPAYMAPEQIAQDSRAFDRRGDIWALGVTLYQCITLERPFSGTTRQGLFQAILGKEPVKVSRLQPAAPRGLDAVMTKVLEKSPERRYQTALEFAEDLHRVRSGQSPHARMPGPVRRISKFLARHPLASAATTVGVVASLAGILVGLAMSEAQRERDAHQAISQSLKTLVALPVDLEPDLAQAVRTILRAVVAGDPCPPAERGDLESAVARVATEAARLRSLGPEGRTPAQDFYLREFDLLQTEGRRCLDH